jgi:hypothetical protein
MGIIFPKDVRAFLNVPPATYVGSWAQAASNKFGLGTVPGKERRDGSTKNMPTEEKGWLVLGHVSNLCSKVNWAYSTGALHALKAESPELLTSPFLYFETLKLLSCYSYSRSARQYIQGDLFKEVIWDDHAFRIFDRTFGAPSSQAEVCVRK